MRLDLLRDPIRIGLFLLILASVARAEGPADALLKLVPPDAGVTIAAEDLRGHLRELQGSALATSLRKLPAFQSWVRSENYQAFRRATDRVQSLLGEDLGKVVDELFGDAVVLTLRVPPKEGMESARGLLIVRVPNEQLLDKLVNVLNDAMKGSGDLLAVTDHVHGGTSYHVREFRPGGKLTEYYTKLDGSIFVWSNSKDMLLGAIDRKRVSVNVSLVDDPHFRQVRDRLPARLAFSVFIDPRFVERLLASNPLTTRQDDPGYQAVVRSLTAMNYAGAALSWRNGLRVDVETMFDPAKVSPAVKALAKGRRDLLGPALRRVPALTLAIFAGSVDLEATFRLLDEMTPPAGRSKLENLALVLKGLLLGQDLRGPFLANLGPGLLAYVEPPDAASPSCFPTTVVLGLANNPRGGGGSESADNRAPDRPGALRAGRQA